MEIVSIFYGNFRENREPLSDSGFQTLDHHSEKYDIVTNYIIFDIFIEFLCKLDLANCSCNYILYPIYSDLEPCFIKIFPGPRRALDPRPWAKPSIV